MLVFVAADRRARRALVVIGAGAPAAQRSAAQMPPCELYWLACIRARRDGKIPATPQTDASVEFCRFFRHSWTPLGPGDNLIIFLG